ncbi:hypothetical protein M2444_006773 [Paenibacillus sp. PastF-3]|uniref:hypothetical protein n=1 Tax=unclassified Paenibacillus TaxID=185978 RepID=UPI002473582B|nr:hypothetical protein [Paenibacillus sp. PastF-3]MDH6374909.1 hypothetical protein [Paenibacillus sp. PastF-3]
MSRKSAMIEESIKDEFNIVKEQLKLKNDTDTISFLLSLYKESKEIPKATVELLIELQN